MGYKLEKRPWFKGGGWDWFVYHSAYGAAGGHEKSKSLAKVKMAIVEADIMETPYPPYVVKSMLANPKEAAKDFPDG